jgi:hypothetical protein
VVEAGVERDVGGVEPGRQRGGPLVEQRVDEAVLVLGVRGQFRCQGIDGCGEPGHGNGVGRVGLAGLDCQAEEAGACILWTAV